MKRQIKSYKDLLDHFDAYPYSCKDGVLTRHDVPFTQWESRLSNTIYKHTTCGAWLQFVANGIQIGSIVEGVEQSAEPITLRFPFSAKQLGQAIDDIEQQCRDIWMETHGCDQCEADGWEDPETGYIRVNPNCPECKGEGIVI